MNAIQGIQGGMTPPIQGGVAAAPKAIQAPAPAKAGSEAADTVQISRAAMAAHQTQRSSPAEEARETRTQTAQEAANGDSQAVARLAQERMAGGPGPAVSKPASR